MIDSLRGRVISRGGEMVLQTGPVCFELMLSERSRRSLAAEPGEVEVFVTLQVREDRMELVGFARRAERDLYKSLRGITGVGTKMALAVLSTLSLEELATAVATGDVKLMTTVPGVGKKTASRLLLELKDKLAAFMPVGDFPAHVGDAPADPKREQVLGALEVLGMSRIEALRILEKMQPEEDLEVEDLIRLALAASAKA
ncbi:Holliday junction branch migration protein RuvA [bacterium]|nr:Holliday junction branch migration protein RuvA [bacterium]